MPTTPDRPADEPADGLHAEFPAEPQNDRQQPPSELSEHTGIRPAIGEPARLRIPTSPQREHIMAEAEALRRYIEDGGPLAYFRSNQPGDRVRAGFVVERARFNRITAQLRAERTGNGPWIWTPKRGLNRGRSNR